MINIKKAIALTALAGITISNFGVASAIDIGEVKVLDDASMNSIITWDEQHPILAEGSVSGIKIYAEVKPHIDMSISNKEVNLGVLVSDTPSKGELTLEVGTNAKGGVNLTVASQNAGLQNTTDSNVKINNDASVDGMADSYTFKTEATGVIDSAYNNFSSTILAETEIADTNARTIYQTNKPEDFKGSADGGEEDITFTVTAETNSQTPAGQYEDYVTFTITGNF